MLVLPLVIEIVKEIKEVIATKIKFTGKLKSIRTNNVAAGLTLLAMIKQLAMMR